MKKVNFSTKKNLTYKKRQSFLCKNDKSNVRPFDFQRQERTMTQTKTNARKTKMFQW